jgi:hypothetical protein
MSNQPSHTLRPAHTEDGRRTIFALVSAAIISAAVLAALWLFDVR